MKGAFNMKRTSIATEALLFLLLFVAGTSKAQNTHLSVVKDSVEYNTLYDYSTYITYLTTQTLMMDGDTTFDGMSYKKLYEKWSDFFNIDYELIGYVREIHDKVYYRPIDQTDDYLLYDFGLGVGDSTFMYYHQFEWGGVYVRVDSIVSKFVGDTIRDCYYVSSRDEDYQNWAFYNTWIEGIGALQGFLDPCLFQQGAGYSWPQLLCYKDHGEILYMNDQYNTCIIGSSNSVEENEKIISLCKKYNVYLLSDEIHSDLDYNEKRYNPIIKTKEYERLILALSPGKSFNLAGLHSSVLVIPNEELRSRIEKGLQEDDVGEPSYFSIEPVIAAYTKGDEYVQEENAYIYENKRYLKEFFIKNGLNLEIIGGNATYLLWIDISHYSNDSVAFVNDFSNKYNLFLIDGKHYHESQSSFVRINIATQKKNIIHLCNCLLDYLK